jgi:hypothetical protein
VGPEPGDQLPQLALVLRLGELSLTLRDELLALRAGQERANPLLKRCHGPSVPCLPPPRARTRACTRRSAQTDPLRLNPAYDSGDHLHPNDAGMAVMANAVPLRYFR